MRYTRYYKCTSKIPGIKFRFLEVTVFYHDNNERKWNGSGYYLMVMPKESKQKFYSIYGAIVKLFTCGPSNKNDEYLRFGVIKLKRALEKLKPYIESKCDVDWSTYTEEYTED